MTEVLEPLSDPDTGDYEVVKITSRKDSPDGAEHLYEVHWRDGDVTFEPLANLSGAADALREFLETQFPEDGLLKVLSAMHDSEDEVDGVGSNGATLGEEEKLSWLAKWHQKTTRGSTQYWLRKGATENSAEVEPSLLKRVRESEEVDEGTDDIDVGAPLAPSSVPETPVEDVSAVLFSEEEGADTTSLDTPGHKVRRRVRVVEETVKMYPHEELYGPDLEQRQNKTLALWRDILSFVLLVVPVAVFVFFYYSKQPAAS